LILKSNSQEEDILGETKPFIIPKNLVVRAYELVKANKGGAGVDRQSLEDFEKNLKDNLYKIWNRLSSGSYFPPPVKAVPIPKKTGGERILGVPTVSDRIAQMVVKLVFEPTVETIFYPDSYGYRPNKSALDAVGITRQRCWQNDWVLEFDIKGLFDNIDHGLLMKAVRKHTDIKWVILYIERWLKAPMQMPDGSLVERPKGTPQGGVISPVLSNLFLHYVFDSWMSRNRATMPWCRYADDGLVHCQTEQQAQNLLKALKERFEQCGLELHPKKTKIVYCKDGSRKGAYSEMEFTFLGYTFRRRLVKSSKLNRRFVGFTPAVSGCAQKAMRAKTRQAGFRNRTELELDDIARMYNPVLRGWIEYYGHYQRSAMYPVLRHFNKTLVAWAMRKYKKLKGHKTRAAIFLQDIARRQPGLFVHWKKGMLGGFA
jgi:RNA-directed DNA polymerase